MITQEAVMTTQQIADRMAVLFKEYKWKEAQDELFAPDATSHEPEKSQGPRVVAGLENIKQKGNLFQSMVEEFHGGYILGPLVAGNHISFGIFLDMKMHDAPRSMMEEIAVYTVKDGKVTSEEFFY